MGVLFKFVEKQCCVEEVLVEFEVVVVERLYYYVFEVIIFGFVFDSYGICYIIYYIYVVVISYDVVI